MKIRLLASSLAGGVEIGVDAQVEVGLVSGRIRVVVKSVTAGLMMIGKSQIAMVTWMVVFLVMIGLVLQIKTSRRFGGGQIDGVVVDVLHHGDIFEGVSDAEVIRGFVVLLSMVDWMVLLLLTVVHGTVKVGIGWL